MHAASGRLGSKTFKAHTGSGTMRLRIPAAALKGRREVVIRVQARVRFLGETVRCSISVRVGA
jgi:hypothetical protein